MRILFWNQAYLPRIGGAEIFTARLGGALKARGHDVAVISGRIVGDEADEEEIDGIRVNRFDFTRVLTAGSFGQAASIHALTRSIKAVKRRFRADIVHVNFSDAAPFFHLRTLDAWPSATIVTPQAAFERRIVPGGVAARLLDLASRIVAVSSASAVNLAAMSDTPLDAIDVIPPGIPPHLFPAHRGGQGADRFKIVFVGRLVPEKGVDVLLRALALLGTRAELCVIGDGPMRARLDALAAELGLTGRVEFTGPVDDAERARRLGEADAMVVPSVHQELFGMVAAEGALCGLPIVVSAVGGLQDIVVEGETGFIVPRGDADALADRLAWLSRRPAEAWRMGLAGRARSLMEHSLERTVASYERVYESCLEEKVLAHG